MDNVLTIKVVSIKVIGRHIIEYGFYAKDSFNTLADFSYNSLKEFKEAFPTERSLIEEVIRSPEFLNTARYIGDVLACSGVSRIDIEGYPGSEYPLCITEKAMENILQKNGYIFAISAVQLINQVDSNSYTYHISFFDDLHKETQCMRVTLSFNGQDITVDL